ncbi:hypothetical protein D3C86_585200 [compost metagenome]
MKNGISFLCVFIFFIGQIKAQAVLQDTLSDSKSVDKSEDLYFVRDFPQGVYKTYEDLLQKNGINMGDAIERRTVFRYKLIEKSVSADHVYFSWKRNNEKVSEYFAISYDGSLYIQQRDLQRFAVKGDRNQEGDNPVSYHKVLSDGKFFYLEGPFANGWSKAFAYGSGGAVGGTIGANLNRLKGVVFDVEKKEFNFIRDCEDLNFLIEEYNGNKIECKDKDVDILTVRENIAKIIK